MALSKEQFLYFHLVVIIAVVSVAYADAVSDDEQITVQTSTATFRGKRIAVDPFLLPDFHGSAAAFTSIPYAEPPVGELRFRRPVPKVIEGEFDATRPSVACAQAPQPNFQINMEASEDCLTLDVFVPEPKPSSAAVMVWIHGGGFVLGAGSIPDQLPIPLAVMNDVIVVTVNYRLNIFGFLVQGEDDVSESNVGMLDQRQALIWVQENIAAFGGDPSRVTIFGESAGGMSVSLHILSPMSKGLFSGAIMQSGAVNSQWSYGSKAEGEETTFVYGRALNCSQDTNKELVECLRKIPAENITAYLASMPPEAFTHPIRPFVDGTFIPRDPREMYAAGDVNQVAIMGGCLSEEGSMVVMTPGAGSEDSLERPVFNKTMYDGLLPVFVKNVDELVKDTATLLYMPPEEMTKAEPDYADVIVSFMGDWFLGNPNLSSKDGAPDSKYPLWEAYSQDTKTYKDLSVNFENHNGYPNPQGCLFQLDLLPKLQANAAEMARLKSLLEEKVAADTEKTCQDPESCPEE